MMALKKDGISVHTHHIENTTKTNLKILMLALIALLILVILMLVGILIGINYGINEKTLQNFTNTSQFKEPELRIVTRGEWLARPPNYQLTSLALPVHRVIIAHSATEGCDTQALCVYRVRMIQTFHMDSRNFDDIAYNFLVGSDGAVYEGRGWNLQGVHTRGYNLGSIGIAFIGTFTKSTPKQRQLDALNRLLEKGVRLGKLTEDYKIYPHGAFMATESPGDKVIEVLKTWPNYVDSL